LTKKFISLFFLTTHNIYATTDFVKLTKTKLFSYFQHFHFSMTIKAVIDNIMTTELYTISVNDLSTTQNQLTPSNQVCYNIKIFLFFFKTTLEFILHPGYV